MQRFTARSAGQRVIAIAAEQAAVAGAPGQRVISGAAKDRVVARARGNHIIAAAAIAQIIARARVNRVIAIGGGQGGELDIGDPDHLGAGKRVTVVNLDIAHRTWDKDQHRPRRFVGLIQPVHRSDGGTCSGRAIYNGIASCSGQINDDHIAVQVPRADHNDVAVVAFGVVNVIDPETDIRHLIGQSGPGLGIKSQSNGRGIAGAIACQLHARRG